MPGGTVSTAGTLRRFLRAFFDATNGYEGEEKLSRRQTAAHSSRSSSRSSPAPPASTGRESMCSCCCVPLPPASDPALAEGLEGASCGPHVKAIAVRAADAAGRGISAAQWRQDLLAEHPDASALVDEAEECMRGAGLWPWPGADRPGR